MRKSFVLSRDLLDLRDKITSSRFVLPGNDQQKFDELQIRVAAQLTDYIIPTLSGVERPTVVVVAGSTGAGKSMLVNSLMQEQVSPSGVLRPTTKQPVLLANPHDRDFVREHRLGELCKVTEKSEVSPGLIVIDAPDVDSISSENREIAAELMRNADVWLFVTTARRYADQVPWAILQEGASRGVPLGIVANRIPETGDDVIVADIERALSVEGLGDTPLFTVLEQAGVTLLQPEDVAEINAWLADIVHEKNREMVRQQAVGSQLKSLRGEVQNLIDLLVRQGNEAAVLGDNYLRQLALTRERIEVLVDPDSELSEQLHDLWDVAVTQGGGLDHLTKPIGVVRAWLGRRGEQHRGLQRADTELLTAVTGGVNEVLWQCFDPVALDQQKLTTSEDGEEVKLDVHAAFGSGLVNKWRKGLRESLSTYMSHAPEQVAGHLQRVRKVTTPDDLLAITSFAVFGQPQALALCEHLLPGSKETVVAAGNESLIQLALDSFRHVSGQLHEIAQDEDIRGMYAAKLRLSMLMLKDVA